MSINRFNFPFSQAFAASTGAVGSGWKLYFYEAGSSSATQATYSDAALTTANTNPMISDGNGRWGDIFLANLQYNVVLKDASDVLIDAADPVGTNVVSATIGEEQEAQIATYGQTTFTLTGLTYVPGSTGNLTVVVGGTWAEPGVDYTETSTSVITWIGATIAEGQRVRFIKNLQVSSSAPLASNTAYTPTGTGAVATNVQTALRATPIVCNSVAEVITTPGAVDKVVYLDSGGRSGMFTWDSSNLATEVTADTQQGIYIAPSGDTSGASGAWVRQERSTITLQMFGAVDAVDCSSAFQAAITMASTVKAQISIQGVGLTYATGVTIPRLATPNIIGNGPDVSIIAYTGTGDAIAWDTAVNNISDRFNWRDFSVDCTGSTATGGLNLDNAATGNGYRWFSLRDIYVHGSGQAGSVGIRMASAVLGTIENVVSRGWNDCWGFDNTNIKCSQLTFIRCTSQDPSNYGWSIPTLSRSFQLIGCRGEANTTNPVDHFHFVGANGTNSLGDDHVFIGCEPEDNCTGSMFHFEDCIGIRFYGGGPGTNDTGNGIKLVNTINSIFDAPTMRENNLNGGTGYSLTADSNSFYNEFRNVYLRDSRFMGAVLIDNDRCISNFSSTTDATPKRFDGVGIAYLAKTLTTTDTIDRREPGFYKLDSSSGAYTVTISAVTDASNDGMLLYLKKVTSDENAITLDPASSATIDGQSNYILSRENDFVILASEGGNWNVIASSKQEVRTIERGSSSATPTFTPVEATTIVQWDDSGAAYLWFYNPGTVPGWLSVQLT